MALWQIQETLRRTLVAGSRVAASVLGDAISYLGQAVVLSERVLAQDSQNRPAQLVRQMGELASKDYAGVIRDISAAGPGGRCVASAPMSASPTG